MTVEQPGRNDLSAWWEARPTNYFDATPNLARVLNRWAGEAAREKMEPALREFGATVATVVEPAVVTLEGHREFPVHTPYDGIGRPLEAIEFHPAYQVAGRAIWGSGMLAGGREGPRPFELAALFYLLTHAGEGGHACPVVCTAGAIRALEHRGSPELRDRFLPGLHERDYRSCLRASQFLTEVQGGSDVGANVTRATPDPEVADGWRLSGEKWFCSVADADLFVVTARPDGAPDGTRGLGCFLIPRSVDGATPNGFRIRRLKNKLGTRAMASAEIDFDGALGWPIGPVGEGFHVAVEELLNTSRWLNAVGSTGIMRRAFLEAASFARHRRAFGRVRGVLPPRARAAGADEGGGARRAGVDDGPDGDAHATRRGPGGRDGDRCLPVPGERQQVRHLHRRHRHGSPRASRCSVATAPSRTSHRSPASTATPWSSRAGKERTTCCAPRCCGTANDWGSSITCWPGCATKRWTPTRQEQTARSSHPRSRRSSPDCDDPLPMPVTGPRTSGASSTCSCARVQATCLLSEAATEGADSAKAATASLFVRQHLVPGHQPDDDPEWSRLVDETLAGDAG